MNRQILKKIFSKILVEVIEEVKSSKVPLLRDPKALKEVKL